ncbi:MAG TPA: ABC transporter permease [Actinocatenispora sp.]
MTVEVGAMWRQKSVMWMLVRRDLAVKYQSSVLGYVWSLIDPLVQALIYWFIFGVLYHTKTELYGAGYPLFIVSGIFSWMWISAGITESAHALTSQARLITTMRVRREIFPVSKVLARAVEYLVGLPIVVLFAILFHGTFTWRILVGLPLSMAIQGVLLVGIALILSPLNVLFRDVERMTRLIVRILMYTAPIIYPLSRVMESGMPRWLKDVYQLNPLVGIIDIQHGMWIPQLFPKPTVILASAVGSVIIFLIGVWVFRKTESAVLKEL